MTNETIYDAITNILDGLIEETENHSFYRKSGLRRLAPLAAAFAVVIGLGAAVLSGTLHIPGISAGAGGGGNGGGTDGCSYMHYVGPVLPLTAQNGDESIKVVRENTTYDFSPYKTQITRRETPDGTFEDAEYRSEAIVTDAYTLTNTADEDRTLTLLYPAELSFSDPPERLPDITVDGESVKTALHAAPYSGGFEDAWGGNDPTARLNLKEITDWQGYIDLLSDGGYQEKAFSPYPVLDLPVTVYKVDDYVVAPTDAVNPSLQFSYRVDPARTAVLSYGANGVSNDKTGAGSRMVGGLGETYRAPGPMYIIFCGDDIEDYTLQGYANMGGDAGTEIDVTATVTRYETTMDAVLRQIISEKRSDGEAYFFEDGTIASDVPEDMLVGVAADLLVSYGVFSTDPAERYDTGRLEDVFEAYRMNRVMYLEFSVTVPAHGDVNVTATMRKDGSYDFYGKKRDVDGYDLATTLGSTLLFTEQHATVDNTSDIQIAANNFGFDLEAGITQVTLCSDVEHY